MQLRELSLTSFGFFQKLRSLSLFKLVFNWRLPAGKQFSSTGQWVNQIAIFISLYKVGHERKFLLSLVFLFLFPNFPFISNLLTWSFERQHIFNHFFPQLHLSWLKSFYRMILPKLNLNGHSAHTPITSLFSLQKSQNHQDSKPFTNSYAPCRIK